MTAAVGINLQLPLFINWFSISAICNDTIFPNIAFDL